MVERGKMGNAEATLRHLPHDPVDRRQDRPEELALPEDRIRRLRAYRDNARRGRVDRRTRLDGTVRGHVASAATHPEAADAAKGFHRRGKDAAPGRPLGGLEALVSLIFAAGGGGGGLAGSLGLI